MARRAVAWAFLADAIPLYPLYALLFADTGLSVGQISALFAIWSVVGILAEVPSGALADRWSRRAALVASGTLQACAYGLWLVRPGFTGFALGFALWGLGGALSSGSFEALVYDGLREAGAEDRYATVIGRAEAAALLAQLPVAAAAALLYGRGGYAAVGWVSVLCCLAAAALAASLPEARRAPGGRGGYAAVLRAGVAEVVSVPAVLRTGLALALLTGLDVLEEVSPLLARSGGVATAAIPWALLVIPLAGAAGALLGARAHRRVLGALLPAAGVALAVTASARHPVGLLAFAVFYGVLHLLLVAADAELQARVTGPARATVTSVVQVTGELAAVPVLLVWAAGGLRATVVLVLGVAMVLPRWIGARPGAAT